MEINVIDGKRSYNISIMLSRIKLTFSEIKKAIIGMEEGFFTEQMLKNFLEHLPLPEEVIFFFFFFFLLLFPVLIQSHFYNSMNLYKSTSKETMQKILEWLSNFS